MVFPICHLTHGLHPAFLWKRGRDSVSFPRFHKKGLWQKMRSGSLEKSLRASSVCVLCRRCRAFPFRTAPECSQATALCFFFSPGRHTGRGECQRHALEADRRDEKPSLLQFSYFRRLLPTPSIGFPPPWRNGSLWGCVVPHGLEPKVGLLDCRLTALLCAPDSPADGDACPKSGFLPDFFGGGFRFCLFPLSMAL